MGREGVHGVEMASEEEAQAWEERVAQGRNGGNCIFCGGAPVTREHIIPKWVRSIVGVPEGKLNRRTVAHHSVNGEDRESVRLMNVDSNPLTIQVRLVCKSCNGGWMEADRDAVGPLVAGQKVTLGASERKKVARWACKTMMTAELSDPYTEGVIPQQNRSLLFDVREPPPGTMVFLGNSDTERIEWGSTSGVSRYADGEPDGAFMHSMNLTIGRAELLVFTAEPPMHIGQLLVMMPLAEQLAFNKMMPIWPFESDFQFPTGLLMDRNDEALMGAVAETVVELIGRARREARGE